MITDRCEDQAGDCRGVGFGRRAAMTEGGSYRGLACEMVMCMPAPAGLQGHGAR